MKASCAKKIKIWAASCLMALVHFSLFGQNAFNISGKILDDSGQGLPFANVLLLSASDSALIKGTATDETGIYQIGNVKAGGYFIKVQMTGYKTEVTGLLRVNDRDLMIDDTLLETDATILSEVSVTATRPFIERKADRLVINVENSVVNSGSNVWEILERSPGVFIDQGNNIGIQGKQGVLVLIDGKVTPLSGAQLAAMLKNMSSKTLDKIEVITNPPAQYDASGTAGIINIVSRRNFAEGTFTNLSLTAGSGWNGRFNPALNTSMNKGMVRSFVNYSYTDGGSSHDADIIRKISSPGQDYIFDQSNDEVRRGKDHSLYTGVDLVFNDRQSVGVSANGLDSKASLDILTSTQITDNYSLIPSEKLISVPEKEDEFMSHYGLSAFYSGQFGTKGVRLESSYLNYAIGSDGYYEVAYSDPGGAPYKQQSLRNIERTAIGIFSNKLDFGIPLWQNGRLEAGIKSSLVRADNTIKFDSLNNGIWYSDGLLTNSFFYDESILAGYVRLQEKIGKLEATAGLRYEHTRAMGDGESGNQILDRNYGSYFPTLSLQYLVGKSQIGFSYGRRIDRPGYQQLNPFIFYVDPYTFVRGNPFLRPQFVQNAEISFNRKELTLVLGYSHTMDIMSRTNIQIDSTLTYIETFVNFDNVYNLNLTATLHTELTGWWSMTNFLTMYRNRYLSEFLGGTVDNSMFSYRINTIQTFTFKRGVTGEFSGYYQSPIARGISTIEPLYVFNLGLQKSFEKHWTVKLAVNNIFNTGFANIHTEYLNQNNDKVFRSVTTRVLLTVTYGFGKLDSKSRNKQKQSAEDERKRVSN